MLETVLASCIFLLTAPTPATPSDVAASVLGPMQSCSCEAETLIVKGDRTRKGSENPFEVETDPLSVPSQGTSSNTFTPPPSPPVITPPETPYDPSTIPRSIPGQ